MADFDILVQLRSILNHQHVISTTNPEGMGSHERQCIEIHIQPDGRIRLEGITFCIFRCMTINASRITQSKPFTTIELRLITKGGEDIHLITFTFSITNIVALSSIFIPNDAISIFSADGSIGEGKSHYGCYYDSILSLCHAHVELILGEQVTDVKPIYNSNYYYNIKHLRFLEGLSLKPDDYMKLLHDKHSANFSELVDPFDVMLVFKQLFVNICTRGIENQLMYRQQPLYVIFNTGAFQAVANEVNVSFHLYSAFLSLNYGCTIPPINIVPNRKFQSGVHEIHELRQLLQVRLPLIHKAIHIHMHQLPQFAKQRDRIGEIFDKEDLHRRLQQVDKSPQIATIAPPAYTFQR